MANLHLKFVYEDGWYINDDLSDEYRTVEEVKQFIAKKYQIPIETIHLFDNENFLNDPTTEIPPGTIVPKTSSSWFWANFAEDPENWEIKKSRSIKVIHCAVEQLTVDMNVALFGTFKVAKSLHPTLTEEQWDRINEIIENERYDVWELSTAEEFHKAYDDYYIERVGPWFIDMYKRIEEKRLLIRKDMNQILSNLQDLSKNADALENKILPLDGKLISPVSENKLFSLYKGGLSNVVHESSETTLSITTTSIALEYSIQSNYHDLHKMSGFFLALKKEECRLTTILKQLNTHRALFTLRSHLLEILRRDIINTERTPGKLQEIKIYHQIVKRKAVHITQNCITPCCENTSSYLTVSDIGGAPEKKARHFFFFREEILKYSFDKRLIDYVNSWSEAELEFVNYFERIFPYEEKDRTSNFYYTLSVEPEIYLLSINVNVKIRREFFERGLYLIWNSKKFIKLHFEPVKDEIREVLSLALKNMIEKWKELGDFSKNCRLLFGE